MRAQLVTTVQSVELEADGYTELILKRDGDKYVLTVAGPGGRIAAVTVRGLNEGQLRNLAAQVCLKV